MGLFGKIGSAVSNVAQNVGNVVDDALGDLGDSAKKIGKGMDKAFDKVGDAVEDFSKKSFKEKIGGTFKTLFQRGVGGLADKALDSLGLPDAVGDAVGLALNVGTGNFLAAGVQGVDLLEDVGRATGNEKLEGFAKAALPIAEKVNGFISKASTAVAITVATGGVGGAAIAGGAGAAGALGTAASVAGTVGTFTAGMSLCNNLEDGNLKGAAMDALGILSGSGVVGNLQSTLGLSDDAVNVLNQVVEYGPDVVESLSGALEDGKLQLDDLQHLPVDTILEKAGGFDKIMDKLPDGVLPEGMEKDFISGIANFMTKGAGGDQQGAIESIANPLINLMGNKLGGDDQNIMTNLLEFGKEIMSGEVNNPEKNNVFKMLLQGVGMLAQNIDLAGQHSQGMRM